MSFGLCIGEPRLNSEFCILTVKCHRPIIDPPLKQLAPHSRGGEEAATADEVVEEEETRRDAAAAAAAAAAMSGGGVVVSRCPAGGTSCGRQGCR